MRHVVHTAFLLASSLLPPTGLVAQNTSTRPPAGIAADAFTDAGARTLVLSALAKRDSAAAGLQSYEATVTERSHIGMDVSRRVPLRSRTLYHREQVARVYWQSRGTHRVRWIGRREGTPTVGDSWATGAPFGVDFDIVEELGLSDIGVDLLFNPFGDRMDVFDADFVQPISTEGMRLYRFASGDTMQIRLPADRTIVLVEVTVAPRAESWETVEGSLWFDRDTGTLARGAYRPSGVWDHEIREPGDLDDVPGFLKPGIGTVTAIVIEYGLYEQRWWLPRRVFAEGMFDWGHGLVRMPLTLEWVMSDHTLNEQPGPEVGGDGLVAVGTRRGYGGGSGRTEYLVEPDVDLAAAPELPPPLTAGSTGPFTADELSPLIRRIEQVAGPPPGPAPLPFGRAVLGSLRYDRVRGLSAGWSGSFEAGGLRLRPALRVASAVPDVETTVEAARGSFTVSAYRRIQDASDWNIADGLGNSFATLLSGHDGGDYYRVAGGSIGLRREREAATARVELFAEAQRPIDRQTNFSLATLGDGSLRPNLAADRIDAVGIRAAMTGQSGTDVQTGVLNWRIEAEAAGGDVAWTRALTGLRLTGQFGRTFAGAIDLAAGMAGNGAPIQRGFLLGGAGTIRGIRENAISGPLFWLSRTEAGIGLPGLRAVTFVDVGWAGPRDGLRHARPGAGVGLGGSFMDGLFRVDIARGITHSAAWRVYFQLDAIL